MTFDSAAFLKTSPNKPGVYRMFDKDNKVIYVGKAKNLKNRLQSYFRTHLESTKTQLLVSKITHIEITVTATDNEAFLLEQSLIKSLMPRYNVLLRDDKSYPYLALSQQHQFPRLFMYRGKKQKNARYFGPYSNSYAVRETLDTLQKLFSLRSCNDTYFANRDRPCLQFQIKRCTAPCVNFISSADYAKQVEKATLFLEGKNQELLKNFVTDMEHASAELNYEHAAVLRDKIQLLRRVQEQQHVITEEGNLDIIAIKQQYGLCVVIVMTVREGQLLGSHRFFPAIGVAENRDDILQSFIAQYYLSSEKIPSEILVNESPSDHDWLASVLSEQAKHRVTIATPQRGDKLRWISLAEKNAEQALVTHQQQQTHYPEKSKALAEVLGLNPASYRIECFDISHTSGRETVASCVVFNELGALKSDYRRFNVEGITPGDDYAALHQVVKRRYQRQQQEAGKLPDVILIDGGKGQVQQAVTVLKELQLEQVILLGISKGPGRKAEYDTIWRWQHDVISPLAMPPLALPVLQQTRDEAHRFAITGHRARRAKEQKKSILELIEGVGPQRRRDLLNWFGGLQELTQATVEELAKVPGISDRIAQRIYDTLHGNE